MCELVLTLLNMFSKYNRNIYMLIFFKKTTIKESIYLVKSTIKGKVDLKDLEIEKEINMDNVNIQG